MLSSSQFVSDTREIHLFERLTCVSQLKFYVLIGLGKPSTGNAWNYDWPKPTGWSEK